MHQKTGITGWLNEKTLFWVLIAAVFIGLPLRSTNAGISGDEPVHYEHAAYVHHYFQSDKQDTSAIHTPETNLKYYGQVFDNLSYAVNQILHSEKPYQVRHFLNAIAGSLLILFAAWMAVSLSGFRTGILTILFLVFSPKIIGHSYNNLKDIPFALGYLLSFWGLVKLLLTYPRIRWQPFVAITLGLALAFGTRAGGLLIVPIAFFFSLLGWWYTYGHAPLKKHALSSGSKLLALLLLSLSAGYVLGILYWPFALLDPIKNPWDSLKMMTHYEVSIRTVFNGEWIWSEKLPGYYGIKWMLISSPLIVLSGFLLHFFFLKKHSWPVISLLLFGVLFPILWTILNQSNLYGGWRHLLFVYPLIAVLAAMAWNQVIQYGSSGFWKAGVVLVLIAGLAKPAHHMIRNYPVEYVYFNALTGGTTGANGRYETDYYFHAVRQALEWLDDYAASQTTGKTLRLATNFPLEAYQEYVSQDYTPVYTNYYSRGKYDWDFGIFSSTYVDPQQLRKHNWPAEEPLFDIRVNQVPVCVVIDRKSTADLLALNAYRQWDFSLADSLYASHLLQLPTHETSLLYRAWTKRHLQEYEASDSLASRLLRISPGSDAALDLLARNAISLEQYEQASKYLHQLLRNNYKYLPAYEQLGLLFDRLNQPEKVAKYLEMGFKLGLTDSTSMNRLFRSLETIDNTEKLEKFRTILNK